MSQAANPYVAGTPLRGEKGFFGRQDIMDWVARELRNPTTNALVLYGQRRIGKTSLLLQLNRTLSATGFLPIYFDLQDQAANPLGKVLVNLAEEVADYADLEPPRPEDFDAEGHFFRQDFLSRLYQALGDKRRPVFLLDEFDVMDPVAATELSQVPADRALLPFLRQVMNEDPRPAFVFVVGRRAEDFSLDFGATFKASLVQEIWVLDWLSAETLVRQAEANDTLRFTSKAVARVLSLTSCHPYLTQLLCQRIWERAYAGNPTATPQVDVAEVESAVPDVLEAGDQALAWLWSGLSPAEKIYVAALAEVAGEGQTIPEDRVIQVLTAHAARLRRREVELAPQDLVKRHILEQAEDREYRFAVELFCCWVRKGRRLVDVKNELDRMEPFADRLYGIGKECFDRRQWEDAVRFFREGLKKNSRHFRARLYLGEVLLELGQTDEAVGELELAYELDRDEARYALVRALAAQAQARKEAGDEDGALAVYKRALQVSPNERIVRDRWAAIWKHRGDLALKRNDFPAALAAYQETGDSEEITQQVLGALEAEALIHEQTEAWAEAIELLGKIVGIDQNYGNAYTRLEQARAHYRQQRELAERRPAELYAQGIEFLGSHSWEEAVDSFTKLIGIDPRYKDVWERLDEATKKAREFEDLDRLYRAGKVYFDKKQWKAAVDYLKSVVDSGEQYKDAAVLLDEANKQLKLQTLYTEASERLREEDWAEAIKALDELVRIDRNYEDSQTRLNQAQAQYRLQSLYEQVLRYFDDEDWSQAIRDLNMILREAPNYRDAANRLKAAQRQQDIAELYSAAVGFQETGQLDKAIDGFRDIIHKVGVYEDVLIRLDKAQKQQELARRVRQGESYARQRRWKETVQELEQARAIDPDRQDIRARLEEAHWQLRLEELRERGEASLRAGNWQEATGILKELHRLVPLDVNAMAKLEEARKQLQLEMLYNEGMRQYNRERWGKAATALGKVVSLAPDYRDAAAKLKIARENLSQSSPLVRFLTNPVLAGFANVAQVIAFIAAVVPIVVGLVIAVSRFAGSVVATPTPKPLTLCNGTFDDEFECWTHGGELKQSVKCEGGQCYAVLGSPDYECEGGVPVGQAWMKQSFQVPQTISPTLSLRYRVFSHDVYVNDSFQVQINDDVVGEFGNHLWSVPTCDGEPWDSDWQPVEFDLSRYKGQNVEVLLSNANGKYEWWNTWTRVDDVQVR